MTPAPSKQPREPSARARGGPTGPLPSVLAGAVAILVCLWVARVNLAFGPQLAPRPSDAVSLPDARVLPAFTLAPILAAGQSPGPFTAFRDCAACLEMVALPGGTFTMGASANEPGQDEGAVSVSLPAFAISRFPVTSGQYMAFAAATSMPTRGPPGQCAAASTLARTEGPRR